ncbi:MAG: helix-turn-helix transcriptional regulator [Nitrososphaerales archaeon]
MPRRIEPSDFSRFYILILLFEGQKHGYEIISKMKERLGQKTSPSLVYPFLHSLEEQGYVDSKLARVGEKEKTVYSLTREGRSLCTGLFKQFTTIVSSAIEPSMLVCAHCGCRVYKDAHFEKIDGKEIPFCCKYCAASYKKR